MIRPRQGQAFGSVELKLGPTLGSWAGLASVTTPDDSIERDLDMESVANSRVERVIIEGDMPHRLLKWDARNSSVPAWGGDRRAR